MESLSPLDILTLILTSLSILLTLTTIIVHLILREMLLHPGHLVFLQCIFQLIVDIHWYTSIQSVSR